MTDDQLNALREWVKAEIEYAMAHNETDSGGYRRSSSGEREYAERLFQELRKNLNG